MESLTLLIDENGNAKIYNDNYDITIHCESVEEQEKIIRILKTMSIPEVIEKLEISIVGGKDSNEKY